MEETISLEYYYTTLPGSPELHTPYFPRPLHWHRRGRRRPGIYGGGPGPTLCLVSNGTVQRHQIIFRATYLLTYATAGT